MLVRDEPYAAGTRLAEEVGVPERGRSVGTIPVSLTAADPPP